MIGCVCDTCHSTDPRDKRLRPSIFLQTVSGAHILVDTSTDLRQQALTHDISRVDAILFTHSHVDHILGLDEVRRFNILQRRAIPTYADAATAADLRRTFHYVFDPPAEKGGGVPQIELTIIDGPFDVQGIHVIPVPLLHGSRTILGFRFGTFAYLTDCNRIPETSWPLLDGIDTLVLDALRHRPHPTHFSVTESLEVVARLKPRQTYFTHMCHDLPHAATNASLPTGVELSYDGLRIDVTVEHARHPAPQAP